MCSPGPAETPPKVHAINSSQPPLLRVISELKTQKKEQKEKGTRMERNKRNKKAEWKEGIIANR